MTNYRLYRNRIQAAAVCAICVPSSAVVLSIFIFDPTKYGWDHAALALLMPVLWAISAVLAYQLARVSWWDYYHGSLSGFPAFIRERREWLRNGYRTPIEVKLGRPPRTRPPV